jgi:glycosyltransferase involved in cell wall biosynthesis
MSADTQPFVSVVTPFYNTADYLAECIESVLAQSYQNWEYILVNNCSTDGSFEIAQRYAATDSRIRIVNNSDFLSQAQNYNWALQQISPQSRYCKVVQADDWIFPDCIRLMVEVAEKNSSVGIVSAYGLFGPRVYLSGLPYPSHMVSGRDVCRRFLLEGLYVFGTPNSLLLRSDLVCARKPFYDEDTPFLDAEVCFELMKSGDFGFVHQVLTFTRRDNVSVMSRIASFNHFPLLEFICIRRYGSFYLDAQEYRKRLNEIEHNYLAFLGLNVFRARGRDFWEFHRKGMARAGYRLEWWRLAGYALIAAVDVVLNPLHSAEKIIAHFKRHNAD